MNAGLLVLAVVLFVLLCGVRLLEPVVPRLSDFELSRRKKLGDEKAALNQRRARAVATVRAVRRSLSLLLFFGLAVTLMALIGWGWAIALIVIMALCAGLLERPWRPVYAVYERIEPTMLKFAESRVGKLLPSGKLDAHKPEIGSTEELLHLIGGAPFMDQRERELVKAALEFPRLKVGDVMRPRSVLRSIDKGEVLGPLVIDELYKTGESVFLVTDENLDTVIGLLPLDKLTGLELTGSPNALKAMDDAVEFIDEQAPVSDALAVLRESGTEILVVRSPNAKTVGAVSLAEITDRLFATP